uniref:Uncharacterized protein n=1 Tax=Anguilla anguilla TaxID=7936 RepID=A0A0E9PIX5_ANGAN
MRSRREELRSSGSKSITLRRLHVYAA